MESLTQLLGSRVSATPEATALIADGVRLSYAELDRAVDLAAGRLAAAGVRPGDLTGVMVERDARTIVWLLAILRQGAAYVPLDPDYPSERTRFIAEDARLSCVVGARATAERLGLSGHRLIDPATPAADPVSTVGRVAAPAPSADSPAYVIYTSGSTGRPKGCVITHGNVLALLEGALPLFAFTADDRWAILHSLCFDFSVWELWGALATGATAVVVPRHTAMLSTDLIDFLREQRITVLNQVPSVFRYTAQAHAESGGPELPLRYVIFGGESVDLDVVRDFVAEAGPRGPRMVNMYGITENTVHSTFKVLDAETLRSGSVASPIGRPLPHVGAHVLTPERTPVAEGAAGELWLSGASVSVGYLHRNDLTKERFAELPVGPAATPVRCYRTGDLVRRLPGGELAYLDRDDDQVKIRGFRIELREIETVLGSHPGVFSAAVCVLDTALGPALAACLVAVDPSSDPDALSRSVKELLAASFPAYMVPRTYRTVERLPLTPSGKLDRAAVAALFSQRKSGRRAGSTRGTTADG
ncbi:amino acid adenylation domain-containing protein [Streptomyces radicis]|uniref:Amino acid adenylation domain-containing protein n=1 Tax=Streptomyces radicis TaxID=1750517 RepID=A0A3A9WIR6_9ACTN|nr:amino acid adenylation domain-containing protein [Streptomyces radicis]RKN07606.1 amino acid adenylation domain-containing protein [Streptomyces radicis]RKN18329.1 amino acid adenylation domain-containing protein [Streptomyces radicis]